MGAIWSIFLLISPAQAQVPAVPVRPGTADVPVAPTPQQRGAEELLRIRQLGFAQLENGELDEALRHLGRAVALSGGNPLDRFNLGLLQLARGDLQQARLELQAARTGRPDQGGPPYALGILFLRQGELAAARAQFEQVLRLVPADPAALYNLGVVLERLEQKAEAARRFQQVMKLGWSIGGAHFLAALYRHARILLALGQTAEAQRELLLYQDYFARVGKPGGEADLQTGRLLWPVPVPVAPEELAPRTRPAEIRLVATRLEASAVRRSGPRGAATDPLARPALLSVALDPDGLPDLVRYGDRPLTLYRNLGQGRFRDITRQSGPGLHQPILARHVVAGDADNDGDLDLFCSTAQQGQYLRNRGDGQFEDVTRSAGLGGLVGLTQAHWIDVDQEGDLDLLALGHGARNRLFFNRSDGTFEEQRGKPGLTEGRATTRAALAVDLDEDEDTDLLLGHEDSWLLVLSNLREGRYQDLAPTLGLADGQPCTKLAAVDIDNDADWDLLGLLGQDVVLWDNDRGTFRPRALIEAQGAVDFLVTDLQLDGLLEVVISGPGNRLLVFLNRGGGRLETLPPWQTAADAWGLVAEDLDRDGDLDLAVATEQGIELFRNETLAPGRAIRVLLQGRKNNKLGVGSLVEVKAGGFYTRRLYDGSPLLIGLDDRPQVDTVRIRWPNGLFQHAVDPAPGTDVRIQEVQELAGSCPFVYTWDGQSWRFFNDFLGGGGLGLPAGQGRYLPPDGDEYLFMDGQALQERDGMLSLQLTEELRAEKLYLDQVRLHVIDHPAGTRVLPDERFTIPGPRGDRRFAWHDRNAAPPVQVLDDFGNDVLPLVAARDDRMAGSFILPPEQLRGLAERHSYVIDLGDTRSVRSLWLIMTGWVYWAGASTGIAAEQDPVHELGPVTLEVAGEDGAWLPGLPDIGFPSGKTKAMPVELSAVLKPTSSFRVRITTQLRLHWDEILVVRDADPVDLRETVLEPAASQLYFRGFSRRIDDRLDLPERFVFDDLLTPGQVRFNQGEGLLTRYGDVTPLLLRADDRMAIFSAGDALQVSFPAVGLPELPSGWVRDYLLFSVGWNKDADLHVATGDSVEPLPFSGMSTYPPPPGEGYPTDVVHQEYRRQWNTRPARRLVKRLEPDLGSSVP